MAIRILIENVRLLKGLSQQELADIARAEYGSSITQEMVSNWENGKFMPRLDMLFDLACVMGVSVSDLVSRVDNEKDKPQQLAG